jgi:predicted NUDIX family NTP pyrophosphohydrolase
MPKRSAGLLLFRTAGANTEVLLAHMGGPFWRRKDAGGWSIPKGEHEGDEEPLAVARREFEEELGSAPPGGDALDLGEVRQPGGKLVRVFAQRGEFAAQEIRSNTFSMEWPRGSGRLQDFPEVDRAGWFEIDAAREKLVRGQVAFLERLLERLGGA